MIILFLSFSNPGEDYFSILNNRGENTMSTKETILSYFNGVNRKKGWQSFIADEMVFTNSGKQVPGKDAYVQALNRFLQVVSSVEIRELIIVGDKACAVAHYALRSPKGNTAVCDVAEVLVVKNGKITSSSIFFDTAAFNAFMAQG
jgi:ketosteroid isomerase-like protein